MNVPFITLHSHSYDVLSLISLRTLRCFNSCLLLSFVFWLSSLQLLPPTHQLLVFFPLLDLTCYRLFFHKCQVILTSGHQKDTKESGFLYSDWVEICLFSGNIHIHKHTEHADIYDIHIFRGVGMYAHKHIYTYPIHIHMHACIHCYITSTQTHTHIRKHTYTHILLPLFTHTACVEFLFSFGQSVYLQRTLPITLFGGQRLATRHGAERVERAGSLTTCM